MASAIRSLFLCLLLLPHLGSSDHISYTDGTRHFLLRAASDDSRTPSPATCSSIPSGRSNNKKLPLVHRLSPCSPLGGARSQERRSADVFHRDGHRLRSLFEAYSGFAAAPTPAPAPTVPASGVTIPTTGTAIQAAPGELEYTVVVGYGTPAQQLPVAFDTNFGTPLLRCKPCPAGAPCDPAFDPAQSSSFARVPCGSPECWGTCSGSSCTFSIRNLNDSMLANGTVVQDVLTLSPSNTFKNYMFGCMDVGAGSLFLAAAVGLIDLSRASHLLASQASPPADAAAAFSYCLPSSTTSHGFLSIGAAPPEAAKYVPLASNPAFPNYYFVELVGISVLGTDLPLPPTTFTANGTLMEVVTSFTFLTPAAYAALRDEFRKQMAQYPAAPPFRALDTCYNFTGQRVVEMPAIGLNFAGGASLDLDLKQMMYFVDPSNVFGVGCLAFAATPFKAFPISVIGNLVQRSMEVVYDVRGGKVGFIAGSC